MNEQQQTVPPGSFRNHRQYYYRRHGRWFEIMKYDQQHQQNGVMTASPLYPNERYLSQQEASRRVYELNGWPQKKESTALVGFAVKQ